MTKIVLPTYVVKLPSTGKPVSFRPFTVKEEKALLLALEENNLESVAQTIKNTIEACTDGKVDPNNTPYYDIEFLFLHIRSKSVGEIVQLIGKCDCKEDAKTEFSIDVTTAKVNGVAESNKFRILQTPYTVELTHPSLSDFVAAFKSEGATGIDTVASCITSVYTEDEVFDWTFREKYEFVESMSPIQQKDISKFLDAMPTVELDASYQCMHCGKLHSQILSGFENFFI